MQAIDEYLIGLNLRLVGPRRVKAELLHEARDSLVDAAEALTARGVPAGVAERRAVAEFGGYQEIAPAYQAELTACHGRRTALLVALALPALHLLAPLMWLDSPWGEPAEPGYYALAAAFDHLSLSGAVAAGLVLLGFGRGSRYAPDAVRLTRWFGVATLGFMAVHGLAGVAIMAWSVIMWPAAATWPPLLIGSAIMWGSYLYAAVSGWRCLRLSRRHQRAADVSSVPAAVV